MKRFVATLLGLSLFSMTATSADAQLKFERLSEKPTPTEIEMAQIGLPKVEPKVPNVNPKVPNVEPKVPNVEPRVNPRVNPKVDPKIDPKVNPRVNPKINPKLNPRVNPEIDPKIDPKVDPKINPRVNPKVDPNIDPKVNPKLNPRVNPEIDPKVNPKLNPRVNPEIDPKVDPKIDPRVDPKINPRVNPKVDPNIDPEINPKLDPKVNPRVDPKIDPKVDPKIDPQVPGVDPKIDANIDARTRNPLNNRRRNAKIDVDDVPTIDLDGANADRTNRGRSLPGTRDGENLDLRRPAELSLDVRRKSLRRRMDLVNNNDVNVRVQTGQAAYWPTWYAVNFGRHHDNWHRGHHYGRTWSPRPHARWWWRNYPVLTTFGVTDYSLYYTGYAFGYRPYNNPFYRHNPRAPYQYNRSIAYHVDAQTPADQADIGLQEFADARAHFMNQDYDAGLTSVDAAIELRPNDIELHQFRSQTQFALGNYDEASAGLYAVLSVAPSWNWDTMKSLYPSVDVFTQQLRRLEDYRSEHPDHAASRFLLGNYYYIMGYPEDAAAQLKLVAEANPDDTVVAGLLSQIDPEYQAASTAEIVQPPEVTAEISADTIIGDWNASREDGSKYGLSLKEDGSFAWDYAHDDAESNVAGAYELQPNGVLALEMEDGAVMFAQIVPQDEGFDLHMIGDSSGQQPLRFTN